MASIPNAVVTLLKYAYSPRLYQPIFRQIENGNQVSETQAQKYSASFPRSLVYIAKNILTDHIPHSLFEEMLKKDEKKIRQGFFFKNASRGKGVFKGESIVNVFLYFI
ncbi:hypothetical protein I7I53_06915 [Histoplasma capsulatum var. duboisii H88]|uniref:Uncharacterized protein n=1 Tax=Ajellomyces capsulatus (strain H88) TaxID=544711 RepID=A0A8A1LBX8_AJEC8|nr:hypothetical protein I7I53_06915 [Histoplasma capsulatum var. duboisii H88]